MPNSFTLTKQLDDLNITETQIDEFKSSKVYKAMLIHCELEHERIYNIMTKQQVSDAGLRECVGKLQILDTIINGTLFVPEFLITNNK